MEKVWTLLWILFAIGTFVFRMVKKMQETSAQESQERPSRPGGAVPGLPTASFQEMLRQMQARNADTPGPTPGPVPEPIPARRTLGGRLMPSEVARPARSQERTDVRRASLEAPATARPSNAPAPPARRSSGLPRASTAGALENRPVVAPPAAPTGETVRQLLRQPGSVRAALVLSEILQRKY